MSAPADLVFVNGSVVTVDPASPRASAVAVRHGRIVAVGDDTVVHELRGRRSETIDLRGRTLLPGFQDAHAHPSIAGLERASCDLSPLHDRHAYLDTLARYAKAHRDLAWITGGGWAMDVFPRGVPTKDDLDAVVPDRPVFLRSRDGHSAWVSSLALERAGIDATTADPRDGRIERDALGAPVGTLQEGAMDLVRRLVPPPGLAEMTAALLDAQRELHSLGITAWQEAAMGPRPGRPDSFDAYLALDESGALTGKVVGALWWQRGVGEHQIDALLTLRERASRASRFSASTVKFMQDGVCENFTAAVLTPYLDPTGRETAQRGTTFFEPEELSRYVTLVDRHGFQAHFHAIGDRAVREVLDAVEAARASNGPSDNRHCVAHLQVVHPDDVPRFASLGAIANGQPLWACNEPQMTELTIPFLGWERAGWQYPFGSLLRAGAGLCFGSDWPVSTPDVLAQIHVAVHRTAPPGEVEGSDTELVPFLPDERLDLETALRAFTLGSAYVNHLDAETGSITVGKRADLVVLDRDVVAAPASHIGEVRVDLTVADGVVVHRREEPRADVVTNRTW